MAEFEIVESIERWRKAIGLNERFILCGHSFGGYLSLAYALQFPDRVAHVILADPWGIPSHQTASASTNAQIVLPSWVKIVARLIFKTFNPLAVLRAAGPLGPSLVHKLRQDIQRKFEPLTPPSSAFFFMKGGGIIQQMRISFPIRVSRVSHDGCMEGAHMEGGKQVVATRMPATDGRPTPDERIKRRILCFK